MFQNQIGRSGEISLIADADVHQWCLANDSVDCRSLIIRQREIWQFAHEVRRGLAIPVVPH